MIYVVAKVRRLCTKFQVNSQKVKILILGVIFLGCVGGGGLDCRQYQILTDLRSDLKNTFTHFSNDRSHRLGGV